MTWGLEPTGLSPWGADEEAAAPPPSGFKAAWARYANTLIGMSMKKNVAGQVIGCSMVSATDGSAFTGAVTVYVTGNGGTQAAGSVGSGACVHEGNGFHTYAPAQAETNYDHIGFTFTGSGAVPATVQVYPTFPQTADHTSDIAAILVDTAEIGAAGAGLTALASAANLATVAGYLDTEIAAILADTNELQTDWANGGRLDLILDARASQASVDVIDGIVDNILVDTAEIGTAGAGLTALATQTSVNTIDDFLDTEVAAIKAKTDLIPAAPAAVSDIPTATQNADAMLNRDMSAVSDTNSRSPLNALRFIRNGFSTAGTVLTVLKEDDVTAAYTRDLTTDPAAEPITGVS